jgi:hypothetical protein
VSQKIDVLIPLGPNDLDLIDVVARSVRAFVEDARNIYILGRKNPQIPDTIFIDESILPFDLKDVGKLLGNDQRAGWYFQQMAKLYFPFAYPSCLSRYLVVDADTIFLNPCRFIDDSKVIFNIGTEFHRPYFRHMSRVHPNFRKLISYSGITHCMLFDKIWVEELFTVVESYHNDATFWRHLHLTLRRWFSFPMTPPRMPFKPAQYAPITSSGRTACKHKPFWRIFLENVAPKQKTKAGASEYEMYFNFCIGTHIDRLLIQRRRWANIVTADQIDKDRYDYVSMHYYKRNLNMEKAQIYRRIFLEDCGGKGDRTT